MLIQINKRMKVNCLKGKLRSVLIFKTSGENNQTERKAYPLPPIGSYSSLLGCQAVPDCGRPSIRKKMRLSGSHRKMTSCRVQGGSIGETTTPTEIINGSAVWF